MSPDVAASTLLYIEDDAVNVRLMERIVALRPAWTLLHAADGAVGLAAAAAESPALIFLDLQLPNTDGIEVLRGLRQPDCVPDTPVVIISGAARPAALDEAGAGDAHFLRKPFDIAEVLQFLDRYASV